MKMEKVRYAEMLPHEIVARRKKFPAAFVGLGGLEWHGEHLAVGNDALKAEKLCELAAARSGGFAFPALWYGEPRLNHIMEVNHDPDGQIRRKMGLRKRHFDVNSTEPFGVSGDEQADFYTRLLFHLLVQLYTLQMKAICLVCGHYPLVLWASVAAKQFNRKFSDAKAYAGIECDYVPPRLRAAAGGDHAAKWETSYLWYLRPDCVDLSVFLGREKETLIGVGGADPRGEASVEIGRRGCTLIVDHLVKKAGQLLRRAGWKR